MGTLQHLRYLYLKAFDDCKPDYLVVMLKIYSVFCAFMWSLAVYAFISRMATGYEF